MSGALSHTSLSLYHILALLLSPSPTNQVSGHVDLIWERGWGEGKRESKSIRVRFAAAPSPAFGTLSHKWERG